MALKIRQEVPADYQTVEKIIEAAFKEDPIGDHTEHLLVRRLRKSPAFIPELSLVTEINDQIVGHILVTALIIRGSKKITQSLSLAPVSVLPYFQNQGIGGKLIEEAHRIAKYLGYSSVILLGHAEYYPRFGYVKASTFDITLPFGAPDENCMAIELVPDGLKGVEGLAEYPPEFYL